MITKVPCPFCKQELQILAKTHCNNCYADMDDMARLAGLYAAALVGGLPAFEPLVIKTNILIRDVLERKGSILGVRPFIPPLIPKIPN